MEDGPTVEETLELLLKQRRDRKLYAYGALVVASLLLFLIAAIITETDSSVAIIAGASFVIFATIFFVEVFV